MKLFIRKSKGTRIFLCRSQYKNEGCNFQESYHVIGAKSRKREMLEGDKYIATYMNKKKPLTRKIR